MKLNKIVAPLLLTTFLGTCARGGYSLITANSEREMVRQEAIKSENYTIVGDGFGGEIYKFPKEVEDRTGRGKYLAGLVLLEISAISAIGLGAKIRKEKRDELDSIIS